MFKLRYLDSFGSPSAVSIPMIAGVNYEAGLPLTALGAIATGTTKPEYICLEKATGVADEKVAAYRILPQHTFETKFCLQFSLSFLFQRRRNFHRRPHKQPCQFAVFLVMFLAKRFRYLKHSLQVLDQQQFCHIMV